MRADFTGSPGKDWQLVKDTYSFSGPPDECIGELLFTSQSTRKMRIRRLQTGAPGRNRKGYKALPETSLRMTANLHPGCRTGSRAYLELPAQTPPGRYLATVGSGEQKSTLQIHVKPSRQLEADPDDIELIAEAGETVTLRITAYNAGNVPIDISRVSHHWLTDDDRNQSLLVATLQDSLDTDNYETFADRLLQKARRDVPRAVGVRVEPETDIFLEAGQSIDLKLTLTLPDNLQKGREYTGFIAINEERIGLEVLCSGARPRHNPTPETNLDER